MFICKIATSRTHIARVARMPRGLTSGQRPHRMSRLDDPFCSIPLLTTEWSLLLRTPQQRLPMLFNGRGQLSKNCPFSCESRAHSIHGSLDTLESASETTSRSVQQFLSRHIRVTNTQTDRPLHVRHL